MELVLPVHQLEFLCIESANQNQSRNSKEKSKYSTLEIGGSYSLLSCFQFCIKSGMLPLKLLSFIRLCHAMNKECSNFTHLQSCGCNTENFILEGLQISQVFQFSKFHRQISSQLVGRQYPAITNQCYSLQIKQLCEHKGEKKNQK